MPERNPGATCESCPYWMNHKSREEGYCRRHSPSEPKGRDLWPRTYPHNWCGEHPLFLLDEGGCRV